MQNPGIIVHSTPGFTPARKALQMKPSTSPATLGTLQSNVERLRNADNAAKRDELGIRRKLSAAVERSISSRSALLNAVAELDEAALSFSRSARS